MRSCIHTQCNEEAMRSQTVQAQKFVVHFVAAARYASKHGQRAKSCGRSPAKWNRRSQFLKKTSNTMLKWILHEEISTRGPTCEYLSDTSPVTCYCCGSVLCVLKIDHYRHSRQATHRHTCFLLRMSLLRNSLACWTNQLNNKFGLYV